MLTSSCILRSGTASPRHETCKTRPPPAPPWHTRLPGSASLPRGSRKTHLHRKNPAEKKKRARAWGRCCALPSWRQRHGTSSTQPRRRERDRHAATASMRPLPPRRMAREGAVKCLLLLYKVGQTYIKVVLPAKKHRLGGSGGEGGGACRVLFECLPSLLRQTLPSAFRWTTHERSREGGPEEHRRLQQFCSVETEMRPRSCRHGTVPQRRMGCLYLAHTVPAQTPRARYLAVSTPARHSPPTSVFIQPSAPQRRPPPCLRQLPPPTST